uniref:Uncharacterized protein n=1 Tax=Ursus maritimus TaxID=29073 RepID=A0A452TSD1_URSMA
MPSDPVPAASCSCIKCVHMDRKDKTATMPDSPTEVKTQPRSTPPGMPPPPPAASQGATRLPSFTPHTSE